MNDQNENRAGYKKTKVGWIPEGWKSEPLRHLVTIKSGHSPSEYALAKTGRYPFVQVDDLNNCTICQVHAKQFAKEQIGLVPTDSVLFAKRGAAIATNKVRIAGCPLVMDTNMMALLPDTKHVHPNYLYYTILHHDLYRIADTSPIPQINNKHINPHPIALPPLPEQQKIAEILTTWDEAIEKTAALIESKRQQKKALMQQLLNGHRRLPGFEGEWEPQRIGRLFRTVSRPLEWNDESMYHLLSVRRRSGGVFLREKLKGSSILTKTMFLAREGDFLISKMQVLHGATGLVPPELDGCHISGSYIALQPRAGVQIDRDFFARLSATPEFYHLTFKSSYGVHIEKMTFNVNWFLNSEVVMPPTLSEQRAIAAVLDAADKEITSLVSKLEALRQQKRGLMQRLLTGQVRVKV